MRNSFWPVVLAGLVAACALGIAPAQASGVGSPCSRSAKPIPDWIYTDGNAPVPDEYWQSYAFWTKDGRYRLRRRSGTGLPATFDSIEQCSGRLFDVVVGTCHGPIGVNGRIAVPVEYDDVQPIWTRTLTPPKAIPTLMEARRNDRANELEPDTIFAIIEKM